MEVQGAMAVFKQLWRFGAVALFAMWSPLVSQALADAPQSQAWFSQLSTDQRADLQGNLVLLAHYGGMVDGEFGPGTYSALTSWQQAVGARPTGVLNQQQYDLLRQMSSEVMSDLGMSLVEDLGGHLAIMLPTALLSVKRDRVNGTWYQDPSGEIDAETFWRISYTGSLAQHFAEASAPAAGKTVTYSTLRDNLYVVTGMLHGRYFYEFVHADGAATAGFRFTYTPRYRSIGGVASVFAASYSSPINVIETAQQPAPEVQPQAAPVAPAAIPEVSLLPAEPKTKQAATDDDEGIREFGNFITVDDNPGVLALIGDIGPSTPLEFRRALRSMDKPEVLVLASDGGSVASALLIAYEVHELGLATFILEDTGCYSACSFIFLAGAERTVEGELGVHQVWGDQVDASSAQTVVSDILEAFGDFGVRQEVTSAMLRTRPEEMYVFDATELTHWGITSETVGADVSQSMTPPGAQPSGGSGYYVVLGANRDRTNAVSLLQDLQRRFAGEIGDRSLEMRREVGSTGGVYFRIVLPTSVEADAQDRCERIKASGGDCYVSPVS